MTAPKGPVLVTGLGAVSVWGWDAARLWRGLLSNQTGIGTPKEFAVEGHRTETVGEVQAEPPTPDNGHSPERQHPRSSRADRFAIAAAEDACRNAGLSIPGLGDRCGVFFGTSTAGMPEAERYFESLSSTEHRARPIGILSTHPLNSPGDSIARTLGIRGPVRTFSSACASGALAIGAALDALRSGEIDVAIAGGSDALCQLTFAGFNALRVVDPRPCRPFRDDRAGLSLGEGAGVLVLETSTGASARRAESLAALAGAGASCDAYHMTAPHPSGNGAAQAMRQALSDAHMEPDRIDFINAHGTGTPHNDAAEWQAIEQVFAARAAQIWVTSTKASVGHLLGSSGAIEAVATVQCLHAGLVHATAGVSPIDETIGLDLVTNAARPLPPPATVGHGPTTALSTSFGFGGANAALLFTGIERSSSS